MASIRDQALTLPDSTGPHVTLRVRFTLRQTAAERALFPSLRWQCNIVFFSVDNGDVASAINIPSTILFNATEQQDTTHTLNFPFDRAELDEDPFWQTFNTEDEITARISIFPFFQGVTDLTSEFTNTIQHQFG